MLARLFDSEAPWIDTREAQGCEFRFAAYVELICRSLGDADCLAPFRSCCVGLILPGERKSVEPIAFRRRINRFTGS